MIVPSYFQELASSQSMQFLLDASQQNLQQKTLWRKYLEQGIPQVSLTFDSAIGRERIEAAASIVDSDASAPLRSRNKLELYKGKIPAIKEAFKMTQDEMRQLEMLKSMNINGTNNALLSFLNKDLQEAAVSGDKRVDIMLLQAMSTLKIDVNATNNPDGVIYGEIDLLAKSYQKQGVPTVWSDSATADPISDIMNFTQWVWSTKGIQFGVMTMSYDMWLNFIKSAKVKTWLSSFFNIGKGSSSFAITLDNVNMALTANRLPVIDIINHVSHIEKDGKPTFYKAFDVNAVSFMPAGKIGKLFNAVSMEKLHPVESVSYADFGPTLVKKYADNNPLTEYTEMEMNAFPSVDVDKIFILTTNVVKASFAD